eukprot:s6547_g1.t1
MPSPWLLLPLPACGLESLVGAVFERANDDFVSVRTAYEDVAFRPGHPDCWQEEGFTFNRCCFAVENQSLRARRKVRRRGEPSCWQNGGRTFDRCCGSQALVAQASPPPSQYGFRAVVALTTMPQRVHDLKEVLKSLVRQSRKPDAVYLSVPYFFARSWSSYNHPWWYEFLDPIVHVLRCEQDFRSNTGLLCILQYELDPDTRILMVDDDQIYHPLLLQQLLSISADIPGSMIGAGSYHRPGIACFKHNRRGMCAVPNLIHTTYGILYQRRFFDHGIFNFAAAVRALQRALPSKGVIL